MLHFIKIYAWLLANIAIFMRNYNWSNKLNYDDEEEETSIEEGSGNLPISSNIVQQYEAVATANIVLTNADPSNFRVKDSTNVHLGNIKATIFKNFLVFKNQISCYNQYH